MNESFIDSVNEEILRIQFPLSVIGNIDKQISSNSSGKDNILIINAYERNSNLWIIM
jgi:hypothetical protein